MGGIPRRERLEKLLQKNDLTEEERQAVVADFEQQERDFTRLQRTKLTADDFELLTIIGRGAFGEVCVSTMTVMAKVCISTKSLGLHALTGQVRVVRDKATKQVYAMKKLKKSEMVRRGQVGSGLLRLSEDLHFLMHGHQALRLGCPFSG